MCVNFLGSLMLLCTILHLAAAIVNSRVNVKMIGNKEVAD